VSDNAFEIALVPDNGRQRAGSEATRRLALTVGETDVDLVRLPLDDRKAREHQATDWAKRFGLDAAELTRKLARAAVIALEEFESATETRPRRQGPPADFEVRPTLGYASEAFVKEHGETVRFDHTAGRWLHWDGRRWQADADAQILRLAQKTTLDFYRLAADAETDGERAILAQLAREADRDRSVHEIVSGAEYLQPVPVTAGQLDADPWLVNCKNGTLDLRTAELRPHRREDLLTKLAPVEFRDEAESPLWEDFLSQATDGNTDTAAFLQRAVGYSLSGDTREEVLFFVHGPAATGKSTFIEAIKTVLGDYATTADFETFVERPNAGGPRSDVARLAGARFVASVEVTDGRRLAQGLVKMLTGGDKVCARYLYKEAFEFTPQFKLWLAANHAPRVDDDDDAMWRRIIRVPFEHQIPPEQRDPKLKARLKSDPEVHAAILRWAVGGCLAWQAEGLRVPDCLKLATDQYRADQDPLRDFLEERCVIGAGYWAESKALRAAYLHYADEMGIRHTLSPKGFAERLKTRGCVPEIYYHRRGWTGIGLRSEDQ